jgi:hypothetical protein
VREIAAWEERRSGPTGVRKAGKDGLVEIPAAWYWITGIVIAFGLLAYIVLIFVSVALWLAVRRLRPKVERLTASLQEITEKVRDIAEHAGDTTRAVRENTVNMMGTAKGAVERYAAPVGLILSAITILGAIGRARAQVKRAREKKE